MKTFMWLAILAVVAVLAAEGSPRAKHLEEPEEDEIAVRACLSSPLRDLTSHIFQILCQLRELLSELFLTVKELFLTVKALFKSLIVGIDVDLDLGLDGDYPQKPRRDFFSQLLAKGQELLNL